MNGKSDNISMDEEIFDSENTFESQESTKIDSEHEPSVGEKLESNEQSDETDTDFDENISSDDDYSVPDEIQISRLESLIFALPEPVTVRRLARLLNLSGKRVRELLEKTREFYSGRGILLSEISGGFQFHTNPENADVVRAAIKIKPLKFSRPALETLAIVAYRQPVTRAEVEEIRRVDCGGTLKFLFERGLVRVLGRKEEPGRPIIYGTSAAFLEMFGLKSLSDLPSLHEFTELWDEHRDLVEDEYGLEEDSQNAEEKEGENKKTIESTEHAQDGESKEPSESVEHAQEEPEQ